MYCDICIGVSAPVGETKREVTYVNVCCAKGLCLMLDLAPYCFICS